MHYMKEDLNIYQNQVKDLNNLNKYCFEQVFKMYKQDGFYAYNIIKTIEFPDELDPLIFDNISIDGEVPWTTISQKLYGTIRLWWLLCLVNKIMNPVVLPTPGIIIKVIKPNYLKTVIDQIVSQINKN